MKQIRLLSISFNTEIKPYEIPAFRGAIIEKVGMEHEFYHNHDNNDDSKQNYHYRYPLVQYKQSGKQPMLVFVDKGVDAAQHFFVQSNWNLTFAGKPHQMEINEMHVKPYEIGVIDYEKKYSLTKWIALNEKNFQRYMALDNLIDKVKLLEEILVGHILSFAAGVGHRYAERIEVSIIEIYKRRYLPYERIKILTFDMSFKCNIQLPPFIGLGKGVSQGFGTLKHYHKPKDQI